MTGQANIVSDAAELRQAVEARIKAVLDAHARAVDSWGGVGVRLNSWIGGPDADAQRSTLAKLRKSNLDPWAEKGRELARGLAAAHGAGGQAAMDRWTQTARDIVGAMGAIPGDVVTISDVLLQTVEASAVDAREAAKAAFNAAPLVVGVLCFGVALYLIAKWS